MTAEFKKTSRDEINRLIRSAVHYREQAGTIGLSPTIVYNLAYDSARMWCEVVVRASGIIIKSGYGHQERVINEMNKIIGKESDEMAVYLDRVRKTRNIILYDGEFDRITRQDATDLMETLIEFENTVLDWVRKNHPDLINSKD